MKSRVLPQLGRTRITILGDCKRLSFLYTPERSRSTARQVRIKELLTYLALWDRRDLVGLYTLD